VFKVPVLKGSELAVRHNSVTGAGGGSLSRGSSNTDLVSQAGTVAGAGAGSVVGESPPSEKSARPNDDSHYPLPSSHASGGGIASVWAATAEPFVVPESDRMHRRPSTESVSSNISGIAAIPPAGAAAGAEEGAAAAPSAKAKPAIFLPPPPQKSLQQRRSSLNMMLDVVGLKKGGSFSAGSTDGGSGGAAGAHSEQQHKKIGRKSVLNPSAAGYAGGAIQGRNLLSGTMLDFIPDENISISDASSLKATAQEDPTVLLGWQVCTFVVCIVCVACIVVGTISRLLFVVCFRTCFFNYVSLLPLFVVCVYLRKVWLTEENEENFNLIYVVTDVRKNFLGRTEYRLSRFQMDDQWLKLKRSEGHSGVEFRPMRKVLHGLSADEEG
jgi:hypothetical protein